MKTLFQDDFMAYADNLPANWQIEKNSDLDFVAASSGKGVFSLHSPGDKFLPLLSPFRNGLLRFKLQMPTLATSLYDMMLVFRYDEYRRTGECIRIYANKHSQVSSIEFGINVENRFVKQQVVDSHLPEGVFNEAWTVQLQFDEQKIHLQIGDKSYKFISQNQVDSGRVAIARGSMYSCSANLSDFEIFSDEAEEPLEVKEFRVLLPRQPVIHPLHCDCTLRDFGFFLDSKLAIGGGVCETASGEGNYHVMRKDILINPYLKVIRPTQCKHYTLHDGTIISLNEEIAPEYFYGILYNKIAWPFRRRVRFLKGRDPLLFATGAEEFFNDVLGSQKLTPGETIFTAEGTVLHSGKGISDQQIIIHFRSQEKKRLQELLPKSDPRYAEALLFSKNNHYFLDGEPIEFSVELAGLSATPQDICVQLEDVFFNPLRKLRGKVRKIRQPVAFLQMHKTVFDCRLPQLKPGVYHLRCKSNDQFFPKLEDYCAFEVIDSSPGALPPPMLSGLPFMYNSRTETRGLETDSFDPWRGESVDDGHYMSCANFQPKWARDYQVMPSIRTYRRQNFLWLGTRNCEKHTIADNIDLVKECDYLNCGEEFGDTLITWRSRYRGKWLKFFLEFAIATGDPRFDLKAIGEEIASGNCLDLKNLLVLEENHWVEWVEYFHSRSPALYEQFFKEKVLSINPAAKTANYGPAPIYASHYKGVEQTRYRTLAPASVVGFWQVEDYPRACRYGLERGTYFLMSCLLSRPGERFCPEFYTGGCYQGCPDGAVNFAHPPYGLRPRTPGAYIKRRMLEYALAAAVFTRDGFHYWQDYGFQACDFWREQFEGMLHAFKLIREEPPLKPLPTMAFCWSDDSWNCPDSGMIDIQNYHDAILDVRTSKTECVPFLYEEARKKHLPAGFLADLSAIDQLTEKDVHTLVLPPLKGVPAGQLAAIRKLHARGVNLIACENVPGLEDLFAVEDSGQLTRVRHLRGTKGFLEGQTEYTSVEKCQGSYRARGARVLVQAEIPVLTLKKNGSALAAFFNIPPTFVNPDRHIRLGYGRNSVSEMINQAASLLMMKMDRSPVQVSDGLLVAYRSQKKHSVILVENPSETEAMAAFLRIRVEPGLQLLKSVSVPYAVEKKTAAELTLKLAIPKEETAVLIFQ